MARKVYLVYDIEFWEQFYGIYSTYEKACKIRLEIVNSFIESLKDADPKDTGIDINNMSQDELKKLYQETVDTISIKEFEIEGEIEL